jgi:alpha/beta superfamily hydrolase
MSSRGTETQVHVTDADGGTCQLEARYSAGVAAGAVMAPPHPLYGGTIDNTVVAAGLAGLSEAGVATLAFNFRGIERSSGEANDSLELAVNDYRAALAELMSRVSGPYVAAGYSFGAGTALLAARDEENIVGVVLLAPPLGMLQAHDLSAFRGKLLVIVGDDDEYAPEQELRARLAVRPDAVLSVIAGADHFFHFGGLSEIQRLVAAGVASWLG